MSLESIQPSTIEGIKRLAKHLGRGKSISHTSALDEAAKAGGFSNFVHARRTLSERSASQFHLYLTAYWSEGAQEGRETLELSLPADWTSFISPRQFRLTRQLRDFRKDAADHLVYKMVFASQAKAQQKVCAAARAMQFITTTGLRPWTRSISDVLPTWYKDPLRGCDHSSMWIGQDEKSWVFVDEPYPPLTASGIAEQARDEWALRNGLTLRVSAWSGMYSPGLASFELVGQNPELIERIEAALATLTVSIDSEPWVGQSQPSRPLFQSPAQIAAGKKCRAPRNLGLLRASQATVPYTGIFTGVYRRPRSRMSLKSHQEAAKLICRVLEACSSRAGVVRRLDSVRYELDEWVMREYSDKELTQEQFSEMYYPGLANSYAYALSRKRKLELLKSIDRIEGLLTSAYANSAPLRNLLHQLNYARKSLSSWATVEEQKARRIKKSGLNRDIIEIRPAV